MEKGFGKNLSLLTEPNIGPPNAVLTLMDRHVTVRRVKNSVNMEKKLARLEGRPTFKASDQPPKVTRPPSQLCDFLRKQFSAIYKGMYGSSFTLDGSLLRLNALPGTTFL